MVRWSFIILSAVFSLSWVQPAFAQYVSLQEFALHDFDKDILKKLGFEIGVVVYYSEMASINSEQITERKHHERIGCNPFLVMKEGQVLEKGYNCRSFFCAGYLKGPKQCINEAGEPMGGVVEINRRLSLMEIPIVDTFFETFVEEEKTDAMRLRMKELDSVRCRPFYLRMVDILVGEGYACDEVGAFPYFSPANVCTDDWRDAKDTFTCRIPERTDEFGIRLTAIELRGEGTASSALSEWASVSSESSSSSGMGVITFFPDVIAGQYGFTAIMDLLRRGVIQGYDDGLFRPKATVNRAEFVKMLMAGLHPEEAQRETDCFPDVTDQWFSGYVCAAKRLGWVSGYRDGMYRPEQTIRRDEGLKIVVASLGHALDSAAPLPPDVADETWFTPYARKAMELRLILEPTFRPMLLATRADAAVWMYRALQALGAAQSSLSTTSENSSINP